MSEAADIYVLHFCLVDPDRRRVRGWHSTAAPGKGQNRRDRSARIVHELYGGVLRLAPGTRLGRSWPTGGIDGSDAWIAALAKERNATLVHKDPEFEQVEGTIQALRLPYKVPN